MHDAPILTALDICNMALEKANMNPIHSLSLHHSGVSWFCATFYKIAVLDVLCTKTWGFSVREVSLQAIPCKSRFSDTLAYGFDLPSDCLRFLEIGNRFWSVDGGIMRSDSPVLALRYIAKVEDTSLFTAEFVDALVLNLVKRLMGSFRPARGAIAA